MENFNQSVYDYLNRIYTFFSGDINVFQKHCLEVDSKHAKVKGSYPPASGSVEYTRCTTNQNGDYQEILIMDAEHDENKMTIPIVLSLFAVADVLGYLASNRTDANKTTENLKTFFSDKLLDKIGSNSKDDFINLIRHGMSHSYYPKYIMGVDYYSTAPDDVLFLKDSSSKYFLNVKCLIKIVDIRFKELLEKSKQDDDMKKQFINLQNKYKPIYEKFVNKL